MFFLEFVLFLFCILEKKKILLYFIYMYQRYSTYPYFCSVSECRLASVQARLAEVSADVPPPLQIVISVPICLFSLYLYPLYTPFLNPLSSPFPHFPSPSTIPSFTTDQFFVLLR